MIKLVGVLCLFTAIVLLGFSGLMYALETPLNICVAIGATSLFPFVLAVACLSPRYRSMAIRCVGGVICLVGVGAFIASLVDTSDEFNPTFRRRGLMLVVSIAGAIMAVRGKWPGDHAQREVTSESASGTTMKIDS